MDWIVYNILDILIFFFTLLGGISAFVGLYFIYMIYQTCNQIAQDVFALKHPLTRIHVDIMKLKDIKKRSNGQRNSKD